MQTITERLDALDREEELVREQCTYSRNRYALAHQRILLARIAEERDDLESLLKKEN